MNPVIDIDNVERCANLVMEMMWLRGGSETDFDPDWIREHGWKAVPVESMGRIPIPDIPRIVLALRNAGFRQCIAVYNELSFKQKLPLLVPMNPPGDVATCYMLDIHEADFRELNRQLGVFSFVLTNENRDWAISCGQGYNVFAGQRALLESMLGKSIAEARKVFQESASELANSDPDYWPLRMARYYADWSS